MLTRSNRTSIYADPASTTASAASASTAAANAAAAKRMTRGAGTGSGAAAPINRTGALADITNRRPSSGAASGPSTAFGAVVKPTAAASNAASNALRRTTTALTGLSVVAGNSASLSSTASTSSLAALRTGSGATTTTANANGNGALSARGSTSGALPAIVAANKPKVVETKSGSTSAAAPPLSRPGSSAGQFHAIDKENFQPNVNSNSMSINLNGNSLVQKPNAAAAPAPTALPKYAVESQTGSTAAAAAAATASSTQINLNFAATFTSLPASLDAKSMPAAPQVGAAPLAPTATGTVMHIEDDDDLSACTKKLSIYANVDDADAYDAQNASEYIQEIHAYFKRTETRRMAGKDYMSRQPDLNPNMREKLIDWLVDVASKFNLRTETLFCAINFLDRFLERQLVAKNRLQLVGMVALLIAAKYEEIYVPEINDFVYICAEAYSRAQMLEMEQAMLCVLEFNLTVPTAHRFTQRYCKLGQTTEQQSALANYCAEATLQEYKMLKYKPSTIAAASVYLARHYTRMPTVWSGVLAAHSEYSESDPTFQSCIRDIHALIANSKPKYMAVRRKFADQKKFHAVAATVKPINLPF